MGVVYAAYDVQHGRAVALKVISPEIGRDEAFAVRFRREARIAVTLEHPNVVPVYETGEHDGALFIAMRRVDGDDLGKVVRSAGPLPLERVVRLARQIGAALDAAHAKGLVHRDVKPGNVLLTGTGDEEHAYLTDFGLAREAASDTGLTNTGHWMGTADYVAPEQIEGGTVSARTDVYSLGCVLFELLTGDVPFTGLLMRKLFAHSQYALPSIGDIAGAESGRIDEVLARATEKVPADRFLSAGDLGRALAAAAAGRPAPLNERSVATGAALTGLQSDSLGLGADRRDLAARSGARGPASGRVADSGVPPPAERDPVVPARPAGPGAPAVPDPPLQPPRRRGQGRALILALVVTTASVSVAIVALNAGSEDPPDAATQPVRTVTVRTPPAASKPPPAPVTPEAPPPVAVITPDTPTTSEALTFHAPSGNVSCRIRASSATCTVARTATTFSFEDGGRARREASVALPRGAGVEADWGSTVTLGSVRCTIPRENQPRGVSCTHTGSGHGFEASRLRARQRLY